MGLDIYLYRYDKPRQQVEAENEAWETVTSEIWTATVEKYGKSAEWTPEQNKAWEAETKKAAKKHGRTGEWDSHPCEVKIEHDSERHPEHMFKIGYFRSSYNSVGINHILQDRIGQDLYSILGVSRDEYCQQPDWGGVIKRTDNAIEQFTKDNGDANGLRWYLHALEIVKETAEWVLAQKDQSKYWLHVSG